MDLIDFIDKEHWEPTLERLFELDDQNKNATRILEAWSLDYPSHGEAAELNEKVLVRRGTPLSNCQEIPHTDKQTDFRMIKQFTAIHTRLVNFTSLVYSENFKTVYTK